MEAKFIELINKNQHIIDKVCAIYFPDSIQTNDYKNELIQQLMKAYTDFHENDEDTRWTYQVCLNVVIDLTRKQKTQFRDLKLTHKHNGTGAIDSNSSEGKLLAVLQAFSPVNKAITILLLDGFSQKQISDIIGFDETNTSIKIESIKSDLLAAMQLVTFSELKNVWQSLSDMVAGENKMSTATIQEILNHKSEGLLSNVFRQLKHDITINIIGLLLLVLIQIGIVMVMGAANIDFLIYASGFLILTLLIFKLLKDIRTLKMVKIPTLTNSIKYSSIESYRIFKSHRRKSKTATILFLAAMNIFAILTFYQTLESYRPFEHSHLNLQIVDLRLGLIVLTGLVILPVIVNFYNKSKFKAVTEDYEATMRELIP
ncbi:MAG: hypothetical protein GVY19_02525 [Bacteroidetes bacterium]|jgi:RNA polymerase sigma-70 factor (ECF subfamily)|nr:hypothetical protein [Bacteroidota bacterium]